MTYTLTTIKPNGVSIQTLPTEPTLEQLQAEVGGYLEPVPGLNRYEDRPCVAYFDEEGRYKQLPTNWPATKLWHEALEEVNARLRLPLPEIVGNLVIVSENQ